MAKTKKEVQRNQPVQGRGQNGMTPQEMSLRGRMGAYAIHSRYDSRELTAAARRAFLDRFEKEVDPQQLLSAAERQRRAELARKAYFTRLALKSAKKRRHKRAR